MGRRPPWRRYTPKEFASATKRTAMDTVTLKIVRAVLVDGRTVRDVAHEYSCSHQWVQQSTKKFVDFLELRTHSDSNEYAKRVPIGWKEGTVIVPLDVWPKIRKIERQARDAAIKSNDTGQ